jgi:CheY-like chemotaxis protein
MAEEIRQAREAGFDGYATKPISAAALHAEIARATAHVRALKRWLGRGC